MASFMIWLSLAFAGLLQCEAAEFGISLSLTGKMEFESGNMAACHYCEAAVQTLRLWEATANSGGGVPVQLTVHDDEGNKTRCLELYKEMCANQSLAILFGPANHEWHSDISKLMECQTKIIIFWSFRYDLYVNTYRTELCPLCSATFFQPVALEWGKSLPVAANETTVAGTQIELRDALIEWEGSKSGNMFNVNVEASEWAKHTILEALKVTSEGGSSEEDQPVRFALLYRRGKREPKGFPGLCTTLKDYIESNGLGNASSFSIMSIDSFADVTDYEPDIGVYCGDQPATATMMSLAELYGLPYEVHLSAIPVGRYTITRTGAQTINYLLEPLPIPPVLPHRTCPVFTDLDSFYVSLGREPGYADLQLASAASLAVQALENASSEVTDDLRTAIRSLSAKTLLATLDFDATGLRNYTGQLTASRQFASSVKLGINPRYGSSPYADSHLALISKDVNAACLNSSSPVCNMSLFQDECFNKSSKICRASSEDGMLVGDNDITAKKREVIATCHEGQEFDNGACVACQVGKYRHSEMFRCLSCGEGFYTDVEGSAQCIETPTFATWSRADLLPTVKENYFRLIGEYAYLASEAVTEVQDTAVNNSSSGSSIPFPRSPTVLSAVACNQDLVCKGEECHGENRGLLCSSCPEGSTYLGPLVGLRRCRKCPPLAMLLSLTFVTVLGLVAVVGTLSYEGYEVVHDPLRMACGYFKAYLNYLFVLVPLLEASSIYGRMPIFAWLALPGELLSRPALFAQMDCVSQALDLDEPELWQEKIGPGWQAVLLFGSFCWIAAMFVCIALFVLKLLWRSINITLKGIHFKRRAMHTGNKDDSEDPFDELTTLDNVTPLTLPSTRLFALHQERFYFRRKARELGRRIAACVSIFAVVEMRSQMTLNSCVEVAGRSFLKVNMDFECNTALHREIVSDGPQMLVAHLAPPVLVFLIMFFLGASDNPLILEVLGPWKIGYKPRSSHWIAAAMLRISLVSLCEQIESRNLKMGSMLAVIVGYQMCLTRFKPEQDEGKDKLFTWALASMALSELLNINLSGFNYFISKTFALLVLELVNIVSAVINLAVPLLVIFKLVHYAWVIRTPTFLFYNATLSPSSQYTFTLHRLFFKDDFLEYSRGEHEQHLTIWHKDLSKQNYRILMSVIETIMLTLMRQCHDFDARLVDGFMLEALLLTEKVQLAELRDEFYKFGCQNHRLSPLIKLTLQDPDLLKSGLQQSKVQITEFQKVVTLLLEDVRNGDHSRVHKMSGAKIASAPVPRNTAASSRTRRIHSKTKSDLLQDLETLSDDEDGENGSSKGGQAREVRAEELHALMAHEAHEVRKRHAEEERSILKATSELTSLQEDLKNLLEGVDELKKSCQEQERKSCTYALRAAKQEQKKIETSLHRMEREKQFCKDAGGSGAVADQLKDITEAEAACNQALHCTTAYVHELEGVLRQRQIQSELWRVKAKKLQDAATEAIQTAEHEIQQVDEDSALIKKQAAAEAAQAATMQAASVSQGAKAEAAKVASATDEMFKRLELTFKTALSGDADVPGLTSASMRETNSADAGNL